MRTPLVPHPLCSTPCASLLAPHQCTYTSCASTLMPHPLCLTSMHIPPGLPRRVYSPHRLAATLSAQTPAAHPARTLAAARPMSARECPPPCPHLQIPLQSTEQVVKPTQPEVCALFKYDVCTIHHASVMPCPGTEANTFIDAKRVAKLDKHRMAVCRV
eukprot:1157356-Pelagomonas_calceolata.AAC.13